jgi:hypothetical protein
LIKDGIVLNKVLLMLDIKWIGYVLVLSIKAMDVLTPLSIIF